MKQKQNFYLFICLIMMSSFAVSSCSSDNENTKKALPEADIAKAKGLLNGDIVLSTKAYLKGVDNTLLPTGCPTKFNFTWKENDIMVLSLPNFKVGKMPFSVTFRCETKFLQLGTWEKDEHKGSGWVKFEGTDGNVSTSASDTETKKTGSGAGVKGYLNINTGEIEFAVDYNFMGARSECFLQTIDKNRIKNFEQELAKYEKDLAEWKKNHGL